MYRQAIVSLRNPDDRSQTLDLVYNLHSSAITQKWAKRVLAEQELGLSIRENGWFHGFSNLTRTLKSLSDVVNEQIDIINSKFPGSICIRAYPDMPQGQLNKLHVFFETLRGSIENPGPLWIDGDEAIRKALEKFNVYIHRYEEHFHNLVKSNPRFSVMYYSASCFEKTRQRFPLDDDDFDEFKLIREMGDLYLHYCEVGKPILDAFFDNDTDVGEDNIRPLRYYSCDFDCYFGNSWNAKRNIILPRLEQWLRERNKDISDKYLGLGYITMGRINRVETFGREVSDAEIIEAVNNHLYVNGTSFV